MRRLLDLMYTGGAEVPAPALPSFLRAAAALDVRVLQSAAVRVMEPPPAGQAQTQGHRSLLTETVVPKPLEETTEEKLTVRESSPPLQVIEPLTSPRDKTTMEQTRRVTPPAQSIPMQNPPAIYPPYPPSGIETPLSMRPPLVPPLVREIVSPPAASMPPPHPMRLFATITASPPMPPPPLSFKDPKLRLLEDTPHPLRLVEDAQLRPKTPPPPLRVPALHAFRPPWPHLLPPPGFMPPSPWSASRIWPWPPSAPVPVRTQIKVGYLLTIVLRYDVFK